MLQQKRQNSRKERQAVRNLQHMTPAEIQREMSIYRGERRLTTATARHIKRAVETERNTRETNAQVYTRQHNSYLFECDHHAPIVNASAAASEVTSRV